MAAAPHLFGDSLIASPELALVDVDLAAQLREGIRAGEAFRPRTVARPEFRLLHPVEIAGDDDAAVDDVDELPEFVVPHDEMVFDVDPVVVALEPPPTPHVVEELSQLPDYIVATEAIADEVDGGAALLDVAMDPPPVAEVSDLPDYVVVADDLRLEVVTEPAASTGNEVYVGTVLLDVALDPPAVAEEISDLPDYVVRAGDVVVERLVPKADASVEEPTTSDYPDLPDLGEASVALEETDVALRKIREQLASEEPSRRRRRLRRGFIAASGLGAITALAVFGVDVQQGVATLPGWLGF